MAAGLPKYHKDLAVSQSRTFKVDLSVYTSGTPICTLPAGAMILGDTQIAIATPTNGTSPTLALGTQPDGGSLTNNSLFATADTTPGTAGIYLVKQATLTTGGFNAPTTANTDVILTTGGTVAPTTGILYVTLVCSVVEGTHW